MIAFPVLGLMITIFGCGKSKDLPTVGELDVNQYAGTWYEIARLPNNFEKNLKCVTATYTIQDNGKINVLNKGYSTSKNKFKDANGTAWVPDNQFPGRLKVRFFWPFAGDYYVIRLGADYDYALVGDPSREYLWILAREREISDDLFQSLLDAAAAQGFDTTKVMRVDQDCNT